MTNRVGTRSYSRFTNSNAPGGSIAESYTRDAGMTKNVTGSFAYVAASKQVQGANGSFTPFAVGDRLMIEGTNLNNGVFDVLAIDATNHAFLTLNPSPKNEGPISSTVRTL